MLEMKGFEDVIKAYKEREDSFFSALLQGESGAGKTHMLKTLPGKTLIHSFDPRGTDTLNREVSHNSNILVDCRWEKSYSSIPLAKKWEQEFNRMIRANLFKEIDTFVIDSYTFFSQMWIDQIALDLNRESNLLQIQDWGRLGNIIKDILKRCCNLPCRFILTAHIIPKEANGITYFTIYANPKLQLYIPALFSEVYTLRTKTIGQTIKRELLTSTYQNFLSKTRLGGDGVFDLIEEPNFEKLLTKLDKTKQKELTHVK